jgi:hypothetical protein
MKRALIIMAKFPEAGRVKTRLQGALSPPECADLARYFLLDAINKAKSVCDNVILAYSPPEKLSAFRQMLPAGLAYHAQIDGDLGARMAGAFQFAFSGGADAVLMIGTDSPAFPASVIADSFAALDEAGNGAAAADAALGRTDDGGYYLIGLRKFHARAFADVEWSSAETYAQTARNISALGLKLWEAPAYYDIDEPPDLERLRSELTGSTKAQDSAPATAAYLRNLRP